MSWSLGSPVIYIMMTKKLRALMLQKKIAEYLSQTRYRATSVPTIF